MANKWVYMFSEGDMTKYGVHNYIVIYFRRNYQNGKQMGVYV